MSVNWIKWCKGLATKREVLLIASLLKRDSHEIAGRLMALWEWCDDNMDDIHFAGEDAVMSLGDRDSAIAFIDKTTGLKGMAEALENRDVNWLKIRKNSKVIFTKLRRHNGKTAKERATEQRKKSLQREVLSDSKPPKPVPLITGPISGPEQEQEQKHAIALAANAHDIDRGVQGGKTRPAPRQPPSNFLGVLDDVLRVIPNGGDQLGFLAMLAYADAAGFEFNKPLMDYIGRAKRKANPSGWLTNALKADLGPDRWKEFQDSTPTIGECAALVAKLGRDIEE